jgi:hypothetical protein
MRAIALASRLARDFQERNVSELLVDARLEILDAINGGLQALHSIASDGSKTTLGSIPLVAPISVSIAVTNGSADLEEVFETSYLYRTIRIDGDSIDNQIVGQSKLLHPYAGSTGTVSATIYCDAVAMPEPYGEMVGDPRILETGTILRNFRYNPLSRLKQVFRPSYYFVEANARNQNTYAPAVIRFDTLPDKAYRLEVEFTFAPARVSFADLLSSGADVPIRAEHVESYLLPIARGILTGSSLWNNPKTRADARNDAEAAKSAYRALIPRHLSTPNNRVGTKKGF